MAHGDMQREHAADVVIIGAGIAGTASGFYLASRGFDVIVCEKGQIGAEQSTRNWGFVRQQGRDPAELPLMMESNALWRALERELNADLQWIQAGNLVTFRTEHERDRWGEWSALANGMGLECRLLSRREMDQVVPGNQMDALGAVYTPSDGQAEPRVVMPALARAAQGRGARFLEGCAVFDIDVEAGHVTGVTTEKGRIRAPVVVCAAGAWSSRLLRYAGVELPTVWIRGSVARTTPVPVMSHAATWAGVSFRQRRDGSMNISTRSSDHDLMVDSILAYPHFHRLLRDHRRDVRVHLRRLLLSTAAGRVSHSAFARELTSHRVLDPEPNHENLRRVLTQVQAILPGAAGARIARTWAGYIDLTPDLLPALDRLTRPDGLVLATGFSGHGFGMGPVVGKLISELVADGRASLDLSAFRHGRFTDGTALRAHAVV